jgi:hypothetical protein
MRPTCRQTSATVEQQILVMRCHPCDSTMTQDSIQLRQNSVQSGFQASDKHSTVWLETTQHCVAGDNTKYPAFVSKFTLVFPQWPLCVLEGYWYANHEGTAAVDRRVDKY